MRENNYYYLRRRVYRRFNKAFDRMGYLSLCSIVESQFKFPTKYPMIIKKNCEILEAKIKINEVNAMQMKALNDNRYKKKSKKKLNE